LLALWQRERTGADTRDYRRFVPFILLAIVVATVLAIGTILFELFYFVSLLVPRTAPLIFLGGILFHLGLYVTAGHPFFEHMLLNATLLLFLNRSWLPALVRRAHPVGARPDPALATRVPS
jgi:hypothetical protein